MASGHVNRTKGRTHGYTDQPAGREKILANSEPSKHGTTERRSLRRRHRLGRSDLAAGDAVIDDRAMTSQRS